MVIHPEGERCRAEGWDGVFLGRVIVCKHCRATDDYELTPQSHIKLLGEVMKALLRHSTLPASVLQGSLQGQEPPLPASALEPGRLQSLGEFWQALGGKPKAALSYTVTIGVSPTAPVEAGPLVKQKVIRIGLMDQEPAPP